MVTIILLAWYGEGAVPPRAKRGRFAYYRMLLIDYDKLSNNIKKMEELNNSTLPYFHISIF